MQVQTVFPGKIIATYSTAIVTVFVKEFIPSRFNYCDLRVPHTGEMIKVALRRESFRAVPMWVRTENARRMSRLVLQSPFTRVSFDLLSVGRPLSSLVLSLITVHGHLTKDPHRNYLGG
ncbi:hypothetical protein J6590_061319 [Homalodisca vitripennis]|nr:hypothetical protein J6590_061319 [Homalodisca vitripennis]